MISLELAKELRAAGLAWEPADGDRFVLADRNMDDSVFTISEMVVEVQTAPVGQMIAFNGTTEWALDAVERAEAIWLPRESQLREALGDALLALVRGEGDWRVTTTIDDDIAEVAGPTAEEAYARALLRVLHAG